MKNIFILTLLALVSCAREENRTIDKINSDVIVETRSPGDWCDGNTLSDPAFFDIISSYPNPATTQSNIQLPDNFGQALIQVFDLSGRTVFTKKMEDGQAIQSIDVSTWQSGMYLVRVQLDGRVSSHKLQVIKD